MDLLGFREPFSRLFTQGMIYWHGAKMSKSKGNVVSPTRPSRATAPTRCASTSSTWGRPSRTRSGATRASRGPRGSSTGSGALALEVAAAGPVDAPADGELVRAAHRTIDRVSDDILRRFQFHTPIAALFELVNEIYRVKDDPSRAGEVRFATETVLSLIQPYAPHVAEELWERLGHRGCGRPPWPEADPALVASDVVEIVVQVNGKLRDRLQVPAGTAEDELVALALGSERVQAYLDDGSPRRTIVVPDRLVNVVA